jgi:hypothetical protein
MSKLKKLKSNFILSSNRSNKISSITAKGP